MRYFEKQALNASKLRTLANDLGIIPHHESQWKWAVRQLRGKTGKVLSDAKSKLGKLSNNDYLRLSAAQRKQRLGVETGLLTSGTVSIGKVGKVNATTVPKAHTHPLQNAAKYKKYLNPEQSRILDPVLRASPSGQAFGYGGAKFLNKKELETFKMNKTLRHDILNRELRIYKKRIRHNSSVAGDSNFLALKKDFKQSKNDLKNIAKKRGDNDYLYLASGGDVETAIMNKKPNFVVLAEHVQGVHKVHSKYPKGVRSVYFKGGFADI